MQKENCQKRQEWNYLTTDPCYEQEEDKEGELQINKLIETTTTMMEMIIIITIIIITEITMIILKNDIMIKMRKIRIMNKTKTTCKKEEKTQDIMDSK